MRLHAKGPRFVGNPNGEAVVNVLRRLTYRPDVLAVVRALHLTEILRNCYWRVRRRGLTIRVNVNGVEAVFYARTPQELRCLEYNVVLGEHLFLSLLASTLRPGDIFFDVGSNMGLFTIIAGKAVGSNGRVFAFEPEIHFNQTLRENVQLNGLSNVVIFRKALGDSNGSGRLFVRGLESPSLIRRPDAANASREGTVESPGRSSETHSQVVEIVSGDWIRETQGLPIPRAVKVDVEGYEYNVLNGLRRTLSNLDCELLCCEIHPSFLPPEVTVEKVLDLVKSAGFKSIQLDARLTQLHLVSSKV